MRPEEQALRERLERTCLNQNFLVEAGAGAGKSHTICQRILHQLTRQTAPESIVAITFTEKATLELKEKLTGQALAFDQKNGTRLTGLIDKLHISTIHGFCQRVLQLFPLESGCGLGFQVLDDQEERSQARAFFLSRAWADPDGLYVQFESFGTPRWVLEDAFLAAAAGCAIPHPGKPVGSPDYLARGAEFASLLQSANRTLRNAVLTLCPHAGQLPDAFLQAVCAATPTLEQYTRIKLRLLDALKHASGKNAVPLPEVLFSDLPASEPDETADAVKAAACAQLQPGLPRLAQLDQSLGYDLAAAALAPAVSAYLQWQRDTGRCSFQGLLLRARDLVRDNPDARALLRRRFRVFYVDEFQDTDPVQAEFLFLLAHQHQDGQRDWIKCSPAPGSLFLVGDPKQAIYRFRGADLDIYKQVKALFAGGVGEVVQLQANFRSNAQICGFSDLAFNPTRFKGAKPSSANCLDGGRWQADYAPMDAEQGGADRPMVFKYPIKKDDDARFLAGFIYHAVQDGHRLRDRLGTPVPLRYGDFLILTRTKRACARYLDALSAMGIPVSFSGDQSLERVPQIKCIAAWLRWLLDPDSELELTAVLTTCYRLKDMELLRRLKQACGCPLPALIRFPERREAVGDPSLVSLLDTLSELDRVRRDKLILPPKTFLEQLAENLTGLCPPGGSQADRDRSYSCLRQFLLRVRRCPQEDFSHVARFALALCETSLERELPLSPEDDRVRVMNLHKAKGLEGKVVILACDGKGRFSLNKARGFYPIIRRYSNGGQSLLYAPEDWERVKQEEQLQNDAERVRLSYVAVTRAEQLLLISSSPSNRDSGPWAPLAQNLSPLGSEHTAAPAKLAQAVFLPSAGAAPASQTSAPAPVRDLTTLREGRAARLSEVNSLHISPSTLDHGRRPLELPGLEEQTESRQAWLQESAGPEPTAAGPMGADWGTMVHRVMELYVRLRPMEEHAPALIRQAIRETLSGDPLTRSQRALLLSAMPEGKTPEAYLAEQLWAATRFWFDPNSPLRLLADGGTCRCELPFQMYFDDLKQPVSQLAARYLDRVPDSVSLSGILNLAVLKDSAWHIVDYKTDHIHPGETRPEYAARLTARHQAQLSLYQKVLEQLTGQRTASLQLCAIALGGAMIPIPME